MALLSSTTLRTRHVPDVQSADTTAVAQLDALLAAAERAAAAYLGYPGAAPSWGSTTYTLRIEAQGDAGKLYLPVAPVTAIASIYQDTLMQFGASTAVASTEYEQEDTRHGPILHLLPTGTVGAWSTVRRAIKVTCTAGYANEAAIPLDLADAVYRWAADTWNRRRTRALKSSSQGGVSQTFTDLGPPPGDVEAVLAEYLLWPRLGVA